jgi:hypothetical protein
MHVLVIASSRGLLRRFIYLIEHIEVSMVIRVGACDKVQRPSLGRVNQHYF